MTDEQRLSLRNLGYTDTQIDEFSIGLEYGLTLEDIINIFKPSFSIHEIRSRINRLDHLVYFT